MSIGKRENAGAVATAPDAQKPYEAVQLPVHNGAPAALCQATIADARHERAANAIRSALTLGEVEGWTLAGRILWSNLDVSEMESLALVTGFGAGFPPVPFLDVDGDARLWATAATPNELRCYVWHGFRAMPSTMASRFVTALRVKAAA